MVSASSKTVPGRLRSPPPRGRGDCSDELSDPPRRRGSPSISSTPPPHSAPDTARPCSNHAPGEGAKARTWRSICSALCDQSIRSRLCRSLSRKWRSPRTAAERAAFRARSTCPHQLRADLGQLGRSGRRCLAIDLDARGSRASVRCRARASICISVMPVCGSPARMGALDSAAPRSAAAGGVDIEAAAPGASRSPAAGSSVSRDDRQMASSAANFSCSSGALRLAGENTRGGGFPLALHRAGLSFLPRPAGRGGWV